jgi:uncharacterized protein YdcH (DUF465 family)
MEAIRMELTNEAELKAHLMQTDETFRDLVTRHHDYDIKIEELESKHLLTGDEQMEEIRLKKLKLQMKDQMRAIMSRYKEQHVG